MIDKLYNNEGSMPGLRRFLRFVFVSFCRLRDHGRSRRLIVSALSEDSISSSWNRRQD